jgi:hypothetical protein
MKGCEGVALLWLFLVFLQAFAKCGEKIDSRIIVFQSSQMAIICTTSVTFTSLDKLTTGTCRAASNSNSNSRGLFDLSRKLRF